MFSKFIDCSKFCPNQHLRLLKVFSRSSIFPSTFPSPPNSNRPRIPKKSKKKNQLNPTHLYRKCVKEIYDEINWYGFGFPALISHMKFSPFLFTFYGVIYGFDFILSTFSLSYWYFQPCYDNMTWHCKQLWFYVTTFLIT